MVICNEKSSKKHETRAIAAAVILLSKYQPEVVCNIIWNKYGVVAEVWHNNMILGWPKFAEIQFNETDPDPITRAWEATEEARERSAASVDEIPGLGTFTDDWRAEAGDY